MVTLSNAHWKLGKGDGAQQRQGHIFNTNATTENKSWDILMGLWHCFSNTGMALLTYIFNSTTWVS